MMSFFFFFWHFVYFRKNVPVELALSLCFPQIASTSSVESMPGADGSGAFGGVSNSKLILVVEQAGLCSFCSRKESEVLQYLSLCSTACCCSSAVLNFLSGLEPQLLAGFASPVSVNPPSPGMCGTNGEPRSREADCYLCRVLVCFSISDKELYWRLVWRRAKGDKNTWLVSIVLLCNSEFILQNQIVVWFFCVSASREKELVLSYVSGLPVICCCRGKIYCEKKFSFCSYNICDCCWVKPALPQKRIYILNKVFFFFFLIYHLRITDFQEMS